MEKSSDYQFGKLLASPPQEDEVLITGISGRFPQSDNVAEFYKNIMNKKDLLTEIPEEWRMDGSDLPPRMGRLHERNKFDSGFFGVPYREADILHPTCRMLLETTFEALIDAGLNPSDVKGAKMGVFVGILQSGFEHHYNHYKRVNFEINWLVKGGLAQRISHYLNLEGPTVSIDTASSSSSYALCIAFKAIRTGQCDSAIIVHSKINSDGYNDQGILHPSKELQAKLLEEIYQEAGVNPLDVGFLEAHSTGTKVGDVEEIAAIDAVFCQNRNGPLVVGSIKSNLGHCETASGVSSLIKVLVGMESNWMPPNINCERIRSDVPAFREGRVTVLKDALCIENHPYFGMSNFGIGGTNAHVLLRKVGKRNHNQLLRKPQLLLVSGRTQRSVKDLLGSISANQCEEDYFDLLRHTFRSSNVDVRGLMFSRTTKRAFLDNPTLRSYKFVPYVGKITAVEALRTVITLVLDSIGENVHVTEIVDKSDQEGNLIRTVSEIIAEFPLKTKIEKAFECPSECKSDLVVLSNTSIGTDLETIQEMITKLKDGAFVLVLVPSNHSTTSFDTITNAVVVSVHHTEGESILLLRKTSDFQTPKIVRISNGHFPFSKLESPLNAGKRILLFVENEPRSGILGLVSLLNTKYRNLVSCVFIVGDAPKFNIEDDFYKKQLRKGLVTNILKNGEWGTYMWFPLNQQKTRCEHVIGIVEKGNPKNIRWIQGPLSRTEADDLIMVEKKFTVRRSSCRVPLSHHIFRGEKVMGLVKEAALSNMVKSDKCMNWTVPEEWTLEDATTVPCAYSVTIFVLVMLARIKPGQTILIHGGTGGIGQSALNIATFFKCTIFTTAGTRQKRKLLQKYYPSVQVAHIGDTHNASFEQLIMKATNGKGVDIILNSLPDEKLRAGLRCLSPGGKFFNLSNSEALKNADIDISCIRGNRTFYEVTLHALISAAMPVKRQLHELMYEGIRLGYVKPLLRQTCSTDYLEDALRLISSNRHLGKVVVKMRNDKTENIDLLDAIPKFYPRPSKVYVLVGVEDFGVEVTDWLIKRGATKLVIAFRRKNLTDYQEFKLGYFVECSTTPSGKGMDYYKINAVIQRICDMRKDEGFSALAIEWGPIDDKDTIVSSTVPVKISNDLAEEDLPTQLARMIGINVNHISLHSTLSELGMDSINGVEIRQFLQDKFKIVKSLKEMRTITFSELKAETVK
ncbi:hypothetical protein RI129_012370 [Pyrocoelia pectoralis]|uniref:Ketosynthase family 3 (KS3) domain-containing protein n=1 Tax=Pyrocoelia pectoralis TaxID=417401 RepID=A0AAN7Z5U4_9COLE